MSYGKLHHSVFGTGMSLRPASKMGRAKMFRMWASVADTFGQPFSGAYEGSSYGLFGQVEVSGQARKAPVEP